MEYAKFDYTLKYNKEEIYKAIIKTRRKVVFRNEKLIEVWLKEKKYEKISIFMEDKTKKIGVDFEIKEIASGKCKLYITYEYKKRSVVLDVFSYLIVNIKREIEDYIKILEKELEKMRFDYKYTKNAIKESELEALKPFAYTAKEILEEAKGQGNDFLGWIDLPRDYDKEEFERIKKAAAKIRKDSEALVVIGIGGSYLGANFYYQLTIIKLKNLKYIL